jgi:HK97 family phage major capsid protein
MNYLDILRAKLADWDEQRDAALDALDAATAPAVAEARSNLTPEEDAAYAAAQAKLDAIDNNPERAAAKARVAELEVVDTSRSNARRAPVGGLLGKADDLRGVDVIGLSNSEARARAITFVEQSRSFAKDAHKEAVVQLIESSATIGGAAARMALTTGSEDYTRGWVKHMSGNQYSLSEAERAALSKGFDGYTPEERAMTAGTGASGGFFVPVFIDPTMIVTGAGSTNPFRHISTVKNIGPAFGSWFGATAAQVTAAWTTEGSVAPDNTPSVSQPAIPIFMGECSITASFQAFEDIADLANDVAVLFIDAKANLEAAAHATGNGTSAPKGIVTAIGAVGGSRVSPGTGGTVSIGDPWLVQNALPERFSTYDWNTDASQPTQLAWACNVTIANKLRALAIAQNSANSMWTDLSANQPPLLSGNPVYRAGSMSASLTTGQDVLLYGNFSRYYIIDRVGFSMEFIPNTFDQATGRPNASRAYIGHWRTGADAVDTNAFRLLRL